MIPGSLLLVGHPRGGPGRGREARRRLHAIEEGNPALAGLLSRLDFSEREMFPDSDLNPLMASFDSLRLRASDMDDDGFGSLCDELTRGSLLMSAPPRQTGHAAADHRLLVGILQPEEGMSI